MKIVGVDKGIAITQKTQNFPRPGAKSPAILRTPQAVATGV